MPNLKTEVLMEVPGLRTSFHNADGVIVAGTVDQDGYRPIAIVWVEGPPGQKTTYASTARVSLEARDIINDESLLAEITASGTEVTSENLDACRTDLIEHILPAAKVRDA